METAWQRYVVEGGIMMFFLIPLALLLVAFTIQGFVNLRRNRIAPRTFLQQLGTILQRTQNYSDIKQHLGEQHTSISQIILRVMEHLEFKPDADPAEILSETIEEECTSLQQRNSQLTVVYNIAPLMGLLGTVFGMISAFRQFALSEDPTVRELSIGIDVALLTTAWGLSIAIPAFIFLYIFTRRINTYEQVILTKEGQAALQKVLLATGYSRTSRALIRKNNEASLEEDDAESFT